MIRFDSRQKLDDLRLLVMRSATQDGGCDRTAWLPLYTGVWRRTNFEYSDIIGKIYSSIFHGKEVIMISLESEIFIKRVPEDVFAFVFEPANAAQWQDGVMLAEFTSEGPLGVGSTFRNVSKMMGREIDIEFEVTDYDPPHRLCYKSISGPVQTKTCVTFESQNGGTLMTFRGEGKPGGFFKMAEGIIRRRLESQFEKNLNRLKALLKE
jgi:uncharacterized protein YndB with AHSA1/START domain